MNTCDLHPMAFRRGHFSLNKFKRICMLLRSSFADSSEATDLFPTDHPIMGAEESKPRGPDPRHFYAQRTGSWASYGPVQLDLTKAAAAQIFRCFNGDWSKDPKKWYGEIKKHGSMNQLAQAVRKAWNIRDSAGRIGYVIHRFHPTSLALFDQLFPKHIHEISSLLLAGGEGKFAITGGPLKGETLQEALWNAMGQKLGLDGRIGYEMLMRMSGMTTFGDRPDVVRVQIRKGGDSSVPTGPVYDWNGDSKGPATERALISKEKGMYRGTFQINTCQAEQRIYNYIRAPPDDHWYQVSSNLLAAGCEIGRGHILNLSVFEDKVMMTSWSGGTYFQE